VKTLTKEQIDGIKESFDYLAESGLLIWKRTPYGKSQFLGKEAGYLHPLGYRRVLFQRNSYLVHRVIWLLVHGEWPSMDVDHINGVKTDNRIENLRLVTKSINGQNQRSPKVSSQTGKLGVSKSNRKAKPFKTSIFVNGRAIHLGYFSSADDAHTAYLKAKREMHEGCTI
jgi:hypothetical protein